MYFHSDQMNDSRIKLTYAFLAPGRYINLPGVKKGVTFSIFKAQFKQLRGTKLS